MSNGGRWVEVAQPDGTARRDWRPDEQPPSPDGGPGDWHVVTGDGEPDRWEWIPGSAPGGPLTPPPPAAPMFAGGQQSGGFLQQSDVQTAERKAPGAKPFPKKPAVIAGGVVAVAVIGAVAAMGLGGGGSSKSTIDAAAVAAANNTQLDKLNSAIGAQFSQFQVGTDTNGAPAGAMQVQFTNNSQEPHGFIAKLQAVSAQGGAPIAESTVQVERLDPGQSVVQSAFTDVPADKFAAMSSASGQVVSYSYPPLPYE